MVLGLFKQYHVAATLFALCQSELCADDAFGSISYVGEWNILKFGDDSIFPEFTVPASNPNVTALFVRLFALSEILSFILLTVWSAEKPVRILLCTCDMAI